MVLQDNDGGYSAGIIVRRTESFHDAGMTEIRTIACCGKIRFAHALFVTRADDLFAAKLEVARFKHGLGKMFLAGFQKSIKIHCCNVQLNHFSHIKKRPTSWEILSEDNLWELYTQNQKHQLPKIFCKLVYSLHLELLHALSS